MDADSRRIITLEEAPIARAIIASLKEDERTGKPEFVDYVTPGKVYRRGNKVFFKAVSEG